jgi:hypothetical protein
MQRAIIQLSTIVVALAFGMVTFAQEPAPHHSPNVFGSPAPAPATPQLK